MTHNCYWIEEQGAFEVCAEGVPLPGDYVSWSDTPEVIAGRTPGGGYTSAQCHWVEVVASPDIIVMGVNSEWGGVDTYKSYLIVTSSDHGFTFSGGIDKYPFVDGSVVGYMATDYDSQWQQYYGTAVAYDEEGGEFFSLDNTMNDENYNTSKLRISRSTDGVSWTSLLSNDANYHVMWCDAYNGTIWYVGHNLNYAYNNTPFAQGERIVLRASTDGGVTWTGTVIGNDTLYQATVFNKEDAGCSANAAGLHVINNVWNGAVTSLYYIRPTSNTTWASPILLWPISPNPSAWIGETDFIIASRASPGEIYVGVLGDDLWPIYTVYYRRSVDNGLTWSPAAAAWSDTVDYAIAIYNGSAFNGIQVVELDDGRIILVTLGTRESDGKLLYGYAVNADGLATGFGATTLLMPDGMDLFDSDFPVYHPRFEATNKGNDVVICWGNNGGLGTIPQQSLVFRP
jgi:hypothetical protein